MCLESNLDPTGIQSLLRRKFMGVEAGLTAEAQKRVHERRRISLQEPLGRFRNALFFLVEKRNPVQLSIEVL